MILNSENLPGDLETGVGLKKLTYKELLFVMHYVKDSSDVRKATVAAGYKDPHVGYKLLNEPHIQNELERRIYALQSVQAITRDAVQAEILTILQDCKSDKIADKHIQLKCLDMIAKMNGFYQVENQINIQNNLSSIRIEIVKPDASL
jgi:hypothetical protein